MTARIWEPNRPLRFGTRGSALARVQTDLAIARVRAVYPNLPVEVQVVSTEGDVDKSSPLTAIGGRGVFTTAIEAAVRDGRVDAAVHSAKDLPTTLHPDAPIVAFPERADPRDVLVSRHGVTLDRLPANPVIGTSSRRRDVQLLRLRPDARIVNIRGNIDTRLRKAEGPELDAIVLAAAGLHRMGWGDRISQIFPVEQIVPAPAQGAIAIQALAGSHAASILQTIDDAAVSPPVAIERAFLAAVGAGCTFPVGAYAVARGGGYRLVVMLADEAGDRIVFADETLTAGDEHAHAAQVAARLKAEVEPNRAHRAWNGSSNLAEDLAGVRVVVTRARRQAGPLMEALAARGAKPLPLPVIRVEPVADTSVLDAALRGAGDGAFEWIVFTSVNAIDVVGSRMDALDLRPEHLATARVAAVGDATAAAAAGAGLNVGLVPDTATGGALAAALRMVAKSGARVLYPRSAIGRDDLPQALRAAGLDVVTIDVYRTLPEPDIDPQVLSHVRRGDIDLLTFASPSSVGNFLSLLGKDRDTVADVSVICAGPVTAQAAREVGLRVVAISASPGAAAMTEAIAAFWRGCRAVSAPLDEPPFMKTAAHAERSAV
ncbi:MAG: hydroxymethylbilane synthase [Thermomicrobiales bacterium]